MQRIELKTSRANEHANWLELFYDLIYVIVIARLTHMIIEGHGHHVGLRDYIAYGALFVPVWWIWTGHTMFSNRFGVDDLFSGRVLTLAQMFGLIILAVFVPEALGVHAHAFALTYAFVRVLLVGMYIRVYLSNHELRESVRHFIVGFSVGAALWAISVFFEPRVMFTLWGIGLAVDMLTPILFRGTLRVVSVNRDHLPERTGLLFIILLGEALLVLVNSIDSSAFELAALVNLLIAFGLVVLVWWIYFGTIERVLAGKLSGAAQLHIYGHLPIYLGLGFFTAFCYRLLDTHEQGGFESSSLLIASFALIFVPLRVLQSLYLQADSRSRFRCFSVVLLLSFGLLFGVGWVCSQSTLAIISLVIFGGAYGVEQRLIARD